MVGQGLGSGAGSGPHGLEPAAEPEQTLLRAGHCLGLLGDGVSQATAARSATVSACRLHIQRPLALLVQLQTSARLPPDRNTASAGFALSLATRCVWWSPVVHCTPRTPGSPSLTASTSNRPQ